LITSAIAAEHTDSVGVFHRPEKVIVLINEGPYGTNRLSSFMDFLNVSDQLKAESLDKKIKLLCGRANGAASCTFTFFPGQDVIISAKKLEAKSTLSELNLKADGNFEFSFESSMSDKFNLKIDGDDITFKANKKQL
ncbi:MAG: hypothetical protein K2Q18_00870, partial [Bdellovibrionales bacterium]|nr:hypothetical protein [Bdellovibrionales bacterium]